MKVVALVVGFLWVVSSRLLRRLEGLEVSEMLGRYKHEQWVNFFYAAEISKSLSSILRDCDLYWITSDKNKHPFSRCSIYRNLLLLVLLLWLFLVTLSFHDARLGLVDTWVQFKLWDTKYFSKNKCSTSLPRRRIPLYSFPSTHAPFCMSEV